MFIKPDEHIIIMDQSSNLLMPDELAMLRDAGVQTIYLTAGVNWSQIQPRPGVWHLEYLDARIEEYERAGLKALIGFVSAVPRWKPDDWYFSPSSRKDGRGFISYTNPQTAADIDDFAGRLIERYEGYQAQLVYAMPADGEFPIPLPRGSRLRISDNDLSAWVVARQRQLEAQYGEIWGAFHFTCCPTYVIPIIKALKEAYPESNHYSLQYTYWHHQYTVHATVQAMQQMFGVKYYVGSEYIQGMKLVTPHAIKHGIRLIASPIHSFQEHRRVKPWMLDVIKDSLRQFEEADGTGTIS